MVSTMALKNDPRLLPQETDTRPARRGATAESRIEAGAPALRPRLRAQQSGSDETR